MSIISTYETPINKAIGSALSVDPNSDDVEFYVYNSYFFNLTRDISVNPNLWLVSAKNLITNQIFYEYYNYNPGLFPDYALVAPLEGDGTATNPFRLSPGTSSDQVLVYNDSTLSWEIRDISDIVGALNIETDNVLTGDGSLADPLRVIDGVEEGEIPVWDGSQWQIAKVEGLNPFEFSFLRANNITDTVIPNPPTRVTFPVFEDYSTGNGGNLVYNKLSDTEIEITISGYYKITYSAYLVQITDNRTTAITYLQLNTGSGFSDIIQSERRYYSRQTIHGETSASYTDIIPLLSGNRLRIQGKMKSGTLNCSLPANALTFTIERLSPQGVADIPPPLSSPQFGTQFNGVDEYVRIPEPTQYEFTIRNIFTIHFNYTLNSNGTIFSNTQENDNKGIVIRHINNSIIEVRITESSIREAIVRFNIGPSPSKRNIIITYDGSRNASGIKLYLNSAQQSINQIIQDNLSGSWPSSMTDSDWFIGVRATNSSFENYFDGIIDEFGVYDIEFDFAQVSEAWGGGNPDSLLNLSTASNLIAYYGLGENDIPATTAYDEVGPNRNPGTKVNMGSSNIVLH